MHKVRIVVVVALAALVACTDGGEEDGEDGGGSTSSSSGSTSSSTVNGSSSSSASSSSSSSSGGVLCDDTCEHAEDDSCDDGGEFSDTSLCALGTDCTDCGEREPQGGSSSGGSSSSAVSASSSQGGSSSSGSASSSASTTSSGGSTSSGGGGMPIINTMDPVTLDAVSGAVAFEVEVAREFGAAPQASFFPFGSESSVLANITRNLDTMAERGYRWVMLPVITGAGHLMVNSPVLLGLTEAGFNYDAQYAGADPDGTLVVDPADARKRFVLAQDLLATVVTEAHARNLMVEVNIESLAHIVNRALGSGIGGESDAVVLADNLPLPSVANVEAFIAELAAASPDAIFAEALPPDYDAAADNALNAAGIPYWHSGADAGDVWFGYYYSLYPTDAVDAQMQRYLHTNDSQLGATNAGVLGRARAAGAATHIVVGAYNPMPCDLGLVAADIFDAAAPAGTIRVDVENPTLVSDGSAVANCATGLWRNLALFAVLTQGTSGLVLSADVAPSIAAASAADLLPRIRGRLAEHPYRPATQRVANIILDLPAFDPAEDGIDSEAFREAVDGTFLPLVSDGLEAAGLQTVVTYGQPASGPVDLTYVITAGGNEPTQEPGDRGPPFWTASQEPGAAVKTLFDTATHPVVLHPLMGIPATSSWTAIRTAFGLPATFAYQNATMTSTTEYHTSLVSNLLVDDQGALALGGPADLTLTPGTLMLAGVQARLTPYGDHGGFGQVANIIGAAERPDASVVVEGPVDVMAHDGTGAAITRTTVTTPYVLRASPQGKKRMLIAINQLHHEAFTYLLAAAAAELLGSAPTLAAPAAVHMRGGEQTLALAYEQTNVTVELPVATGSSVRLRIYDHNGEVAEDTTLAYQGGLSRQLAKRSLLVVEPAGN